MDNDRTLCGQCGALEDEDGCSCEVYKEPLEIEIAGVCYICSFKIQTSFDNICGFYDEFLKDLDKKPDFCKIKCLVEKNELIDKIIKNIKESPSAESLNYFGGDHCAVVDTIIDEINELRNK